MAQSVDELAAELSRQAHQMLSKRDGILRLRDSKAAGEDKRLVVEAQIQNVTSQAEHARSMLAEKEWHHQDNRAALADAEIRLLDVLSRLEGVKDDVHEKRSASCHSDDAVKEQRKEAERSDEALAVAQQQYIDQEASLEDLDAQIKDRLGRVQATLDADYISPVCTTVVVHKGQHVELRCAETGCGAKAEYSNGDFFDGTVGLARHYEKAHQTQTSKRFVADNCAFRVVSERDIILIRQVQESDYVVRVLGLEQSALDQPIRQVYSATDAALTAKEPTHGSELNKYFKNIMYVDGKYKEIRCGRPDCGANCTTQGFFYEGLKGYSKHLRFSHHADISREELLAHCKVRDVSGNDLALLKQVHTDEQFEVVLGPHQCHLETRIERVPCQKGLATAGRGAEKTKERKSIATKIPLSRSLNDLTNGHKRQKIRHSHSAVYDKKESLSPEQDTTCIAKMDSES